MIYTAIDRFVKEYSYHHDILYAAIGLILQTLSRGKVNKDIWVIRLKKIVPEIIREVENTPKPTQTNAYEGISYSPDA